MVITTVVLWVTKVGRQEVAIIFQQTLQIVNRISTDGTLQISDRGDYGCSKFQLCPPNFSGMRILALRFGFFMVPMVRGNQGKSGNFKKSGKVRENSDGQGKSGNSKVPWCKS